MKVNGCVTFWNDCGPFAATVCETLKLNGPGKQVAQIAKIKSLTQRITHKKQMIFLIFLKFIYIPASVTKFNVSWA